MSVSEGQPALTPDSIERVRAEAEREVEWLERQKQRGIEVRERLKWIRRFVRVAAALAREREARGVLRDDLERYEEGVRLLEGRVRDLEEALGRVTRDLRLYHPATDHRAEDGCHYCAHLDRAEALVGLPE